jgi:hypothetical protein
VWNGRLSVNDTFSETCSQSQSHITSDGQSVSMSWCQAQSGTFDQRLFFSKLPSCLFGAPSLRRGRFCHVSVVVIEVYNSQSLFITNIFIKLKIYMCYTHLQYNTKCTIYTGLVQSRKCTIYTGLVQSRLGTADYALLTSNLVYHGSHRHLNSRTHDRRQVWASYIRKVFSTFLHVYIENLYHHLWNMR